MANFAVSVSEELLAKCNAVLVKLQRDGEKKADALNRAFDIALTTLEDEQLKYNGVDIKSLNSSLENIRSLFMATVNGNEEKKIAYETKIADVKNKKDALENELREKIAEAQKAKAEAEAKAEALTKARESDLKDLKIATEKATSAEALTAETKKNNETLQTELSKAKEQLAGYDDLKKSEFENKTEVINLRHQLEELKKEYQNDLNTKELEYQHQLDQAKASADLELEKALIAKEREMNEEIINLNRENAKLQAQIEQLQQK
jgi:hypothetical protein